MCSRKTSGSHNFVCHQFAVHSKHGSWLREGVLGSFAISFHDECCLWHGFHFPFVYRNTAMSVSNPAPACLSNWISFFNWGDFNLAAISLASNPRWFSNGAEVGNDFLSRRFQKIVVVIIRCLAVCFGSSKEPWKGL